MKYYGIRNWRDEQGSELTKAKKLIKDKPMPLIGISRITQIPYQTLKNYSSGTLSLDKATWEHVNKLSQVYDIVKVSDSFGGTNPNDFVEELHQLFSHLALAEPHYNSLIDRLEQIIISDPVAVAELYKAEHKK